MGSIFSKNFENQIEKAEYISLDILEAGISRIHQFVSVLKVPYAMMTAFRGANPREKNHKLNTELISDLRSFGVGGIQLNGYYQEKGYDKPSKELSFFIPYLGEDEPAFKEFILQEVVKFDQDCAAYSDGKNWGLLWKDGNWEQKGSSVSFTPDATKVAWSKLRGKTFNLVECAFYSGSVAGRIGWDNLGLIPGVPFFNDSIKRAIQLRENHKK